MLSLGSEEVIETCDHEEADTRILFHILDSCKKLKNKIQVGTVDTDVVVLVIGLFSKLKQVSNDLDLWIQFGMGTSLRNI